MTVERPLLTKEDVSRAESRIGVTHPVLAVIEHHLPTIAQLNAGYSSITDNQGQQRYVREHYGFLADAILEAEPFTIAPLDLVAVWSRATEVFSYYHRHRVAGMIATAHAIQGAENLAWRRFPRYYAETSQLPDEVSADRSGLLYVRGRLDQVGASLKEVDFYVYGRRGHVMEEAFHLARRQADGDEEAGRELEALIAYQKEHTTLVLGELHENFGNGYIPLYYLIDEALEAIPA